MTSSPFDDSSLIGYDVSSPAVNIALPYDYSPSRQSECIVRHVSPNRHITTRTQVLQPTLQDPYPLGDKSTYSVTVDGTSVASEVLVQPCLISADNSRNELARRIGKERTSNRVTLWVPLEKPIDISRGCVTIGLSLDKAEPVRHEIEFSHLTRVEGSDQKSIQYNERQLRAKGFKPSNHVALKAGHVTMIVDPVAQELKDIEIDLYRQPKDHDAAEITFACNSSNLDHVTALVTGLEYYMATPEGSKNTRAAALFTQINAHQQALEQNPSTEPTPAINASINEAVDILWDHARINAFFSRGAKKEQELEENALKSATTGELLAKGRQYVDQLNEIKGAKGVSKAGNFLRGNLGKFKGRARAIATLLRAKLEDSRLSSSDRTKIEEMLAEIASVA